MQLSKQALLLLFSFAQPASSLHRGKTIGAMMPTPSPLSLGTISAVGDPHMTNLYGQRFDVVQPGQHTLIRIPTHSPVGRVLLLVDAEAKHEGSACSDMYFKTVNISGTWTRGKRPEDLRFWAFRQGASEDRSWVHQTEYFVPEYLRQAPCRYGPACRRSSRTRRSYEGCNA
ncbi:unnamed protein product [Prorocentrum cordatum]|uniref:Phospholipase B-like n=1 Tax=Prorocentrum cordatum TaxID=2364126 RepID=A0ABN9SIW5_9DINO|nr:unnamed protein product [Polarella glacialis]